MSLSPTDAMKTRLQALAARAAEDEAPYDFDEFHRRAGARAATGASTPLIRPARAPAALRVLRVAAVVAPLALLLVIAGVARQPGTTTLPQAAAVTAWEEPALVRTGLAAPVLEIEDRIAWLDSMLSAPPEAVAEEERAALLRGRRTLVDSLQQVRYAQALLAY